MDTVYGLAEITWITMTIESMTYTGIQIQEKTNSNRIDTSTFNSTGVVSVINTHIRTHDRTNTFYPSTLVRYLA